MRDRSPASAGLSHGPVTLGQAMKVIKGLLSNRDTLAKLALLGGAPLGERHPTILDAYVNQLAKGIFSEELRIEKAGPAQTYPPSLLAALAARGLNNPAGRLQARVVATANGQSLTEFVLGKDHVQEVSDLSGLPQSATEKNYLVAQRALDAPVDGHIDRQVRADVERWRNELPPEVIARLDASLSIDPLDPDRKTAIWSAGAEQIVTGYYDALLKGDEKALEGAKAEFEALPQELLVSEPTQRIKAQFLRQLEVAYLDARWAVAFGDDRKLVRLHGENLSLWRRESPDLAAKWDALPLERKLPLHLHRDDLPVTGRWSKAEWQEKALGLLKHKDNPRLRNIEITAFYAGHYQRDPDLKWAGMAAYASNKVGIGIEISGGYLVPGLVAGQFLTGQNTAVARETFEMAEALLALGNYLIYEDIAWQYLAYSEGGIKEIRRAHAEGQVTTGVWLAWEEIDEGKELVSKGYKSLGEELIWQGNTRLIYHEQLDVVAPIYSGTGPLWYAVTQFLNSPIRGDEKNYFKDYYPGQSIADHELRLEWTVKFMLPAWQTLDEDSRALVLMDMARFVRQDKSHP